MKKILASVLCCLCLSGCGIPKDALQLSPESLQDRQTQTRRFETTDKVTMLTAATAAAGQVLDGLFQNLLVFDGRLSCSLATLLRRIIEFLSHGSSFSIPA